MFGNRGDLSPDPSRVMEEELAVFGDFLTSMSDPQLEGFRYIGLLEHRMLVLKEAVIDEGTLPVTLMGVNYFKDLEVRHSKDLMYELFLFAQRVYQASEEERWEIRASTLLKHQASIRKVALIEEKMTQRAAQKQLGKVAATPIVAQL